MRKAAAARRRAAAFLWGDYGGAPVDYVMAIAAVYALMVVCVVRNLSQGA